MSQPVQHHKQQERRLRTQESEFEPGEPNHNKNSSLNFVDQDPTTTTTTPTTTSTTTTHVNITRRPYPVKPSTLKAATAYSLFSDPNAFGLQTIYEKTHYLSSSLKGKLWWDVNGDGKRGDYRNYTLNSMEYDYGVPNVANIYLITCDDEDEAKKSGSTTSKPFNGCDASPLKQSLNGDAGIYEFNDLSHVPSGRYYVMYEAPWGWRMSGNTLPLGRRQAERDGEVYFECAPDGGNGGLFGDMARENGDFDYGGYCARSVGCVEIGYRSELEAKFKTLEPLQDTNYYHDIIQGDATPALYATMGDKMVAFPTPQVMDVGMSQEEWDLPAKQYADARVTLRLPVTRESSLVTLMTNVTASPESFGTSVNQKAMETALKMYLADYFLAPGSGYMPDKKNDSVAFSLSGVDLFDAKIERKRKNKRDETDSSTRYLRASRRTQELKDKGDDVIEITYTFTARGEYRPPPHNQLGDIVQNSINADPTKFVRAIREDYSLPFQDLEGVTSKHLTVGSSSQNLESVNLSPLSVSSAAHKVCAGCVGIQSIITGDDNKGMEPWALIPVLILSLMIGALVVLFLNRRLWKRRRHGQADIDREFEMRTKDFTVSCHDITKEKDAHREISGLMDEEDTVCHPTASSKKGYNKEKMRKKTKRLDDRSHRSGNSDTSGITSSVHAEEERFSSNSSDDESKGSRRRHRGPKKKKRLDHSKRLVRSDISDRIRAEEEDSSSSSDEDEIEEARQKRHRKDMTAKKQRSERTSGGRGGPPSLDELRQMDRKRSSKRMDGSTSLDQLRQMDRKRSSERMDRSY